MIGALIVAASVALPAIASTAETTYVRAPRTLAVDANGRCFVDEAGRPFFYLGDTAWELFHRLTYEEALVYLDDRAARGFTVIQAVALAERDGLNTPTPDGWLPLIDRDPSQPDVRRGPVNDYWDHVEAIIEAANARGLIVGLLPTWGDKWNLKWGIGPEVFTPENAEAFGEWIGARFRDKSVIWILGGDRNVETEQHRAVIEAMAHGVKRGDRGRHLITFHPMGGFGSSAFFADAEWLDFHMRQNGHNTTYDAFAGTARDFAREPAKPVIDGEPLYEDHPIRFEPEKWGHSLAVDVRRAAYWNLFNGACGHTYGHHSIWQMAAPDREPINHAILTWREALSAPGGDDMRHAKALLQSRPGWETRTPAPSLIVPSSVPTAMPGAGERRFVATLAPDGSWAMVYVPVGRRFEIDAKLLDAERLRAWWFDPRTGVTAEIGVFEASGRIAFESPTPGEVLDWVLVLDDAEIARPPPGNVGQRARDPEEYANAVRLAANR